MSTPRRSVDERLAEFYDRLGKLQLPATPEEAFRQVCETIDAVEDELSGIAKADPPPDPGKNDGRMYAPVDDMIMRHAGGSITATTRGHIIEIAEDASVVIRRFSTGQIEFARNGAS